MANKKQIEEEKAKNPSELKFIEAKQKAIDNANTLSQIVRNSPIGKIAKLENLIKSPIDEFNPEGDFRVINFNDNWLDIPIEANKSRRTKSIRLNDEQVSIVHLIQNIWIDKGSSEHHIKYYSKVLKKVIREINIDRKKHFHSFRHSFGMRRIIELNGNISQLRDEMGHSSVNVTEIYSKANPKRLLVDFPSLKRYININNKYIMDTDVMDTELDFSKRNREDIN